MLQHNIIYLRYFLLQSDLKFSFDVEHSFAQGADICTMPPKIFEGMYNHILTDKGLELFDIDYQKTIKEFTKTR